jgi:hypothetical protein
MLASPSTMKSLRKKDLGELIIVQLGRPHHVAIALTLPRYQGIFPIKFELNQSDIAQDY